MKHDLRLTQTQVLHALFVFDVDFKDDATRERFEKKHGFRIILVS